MNAANPSRAGEGLAASAAMTTARPTAFQRDTGEASFPVAGAVLLLVLLAIAAWAWVAGRKGYKWPRRLSASTRWPFPAPSGQPLKIVASARLDVGGRAHVVEWGGQQVLIAVNGSSAPVVLARRRLDDEARKLAS